MTEWLDYIIIYMSGCLNVWSSMDYIIIWMSECLNVWSSLDYLIIQMSGCLVKYALHNNVNVWISECLIKSGCLNYTGHMTNCWMPKDWMTLMIWCTNVITPWVAINIWWTMLAVAWLHLVDCQCPDTQCSAKLHAPEYNYIAEMSWVTASLYYCRRLR